ncbi:MAG: DUF4097 domain-containing protein [Lachnoclostridium sp.]|jgi:DUF4097 and DUF4098 domain-containing protein YvlB
MNKNEYLNALKEALKDIDESVMEEIVTDYEEHFRIGLENGKSEEEICKELGAINDLAEEIREVYNTKKNTDKKTDDKSNEESINNEDSNEENVNEKNVNEEKKTSEEQNGSRNIFKEWYSHINIDGEKISDVINSALDTAGDAISKIDVNEIGRTIKSTLEQATSTLNNFADNYLKNQGMGPFEFNKKHAEGYTENVSKSYDANRESQNPANETVKNNVSYDACSDNEDTEEKREVSENKESKDEFENSQGQSSDHKETVNDEKTLKEETSNIADTSQNRLNLVVDGICADLIVEKSTNGKLNLFYENNGNERQKQLYEFYSYKEENTVYAGIRRVGKTVFLFNTKLYTIRIYIEIPDNTGEVNLRTASGDIKLTNVNGESITANAASGDILLDRVNTSDLRIKASSGDINLDEVNSNRVRAESSSGDIEVNNLEAKFLSLRSSSGDIVIRNIKADVADCSPLSGDLEIDGMITSECKIRSTSGDIKICDFTMNNADVSSISGDINMNLVVGDGLRVVNGSGDVSAEVNVKRGHASSRSGDVKVICNGDIILESESTSGNINITLKNYNNGYNITSKTTSGTLYIDYDNMRQRNQKSGNYTHGNQGSKLILSTVSGDIHLSD